ncbi:unnamed protein product, partial [Prorocentrum cordatum]
AIAEIREWPPSQFGDNMEFQSMCLGTVEFSRELGLRKPSFLDETPRLLARLGEPGAIDNVMIHQCRAVPKEKHHPVTLQFLGDDSPLKALVLQLPSAGGELPERLRRAAQALIDVPFDDHIVEGPRAKAKRVPGNSRLAEFPFVASSLRLDYNIGALAGVVDATGAGIQRAWNSWSAVVNMREPTAPLRLAPQLARKKVYELNTHSRFQPQGLGREPDGPGDFDELGGPGGGGPGDMIAAAHVAGPDEIERYTDLSDSQKLMAEFLRGAVQVHEYVAVPSGPDDDRPFSAYQVRAKQARDIVVETSGTPPTDVTTWLFHPMGVFIDLSWEAGSAPERLDVFQVSPVSTCASMFTVFGDDASKRSCIFTFSVVEPAIDGCIGLGGRTSMSEPNVPVLRLLDELSANRFRAVDGLCARSRGSPLVYGSRRATSKRFDFQCVLAKGSIFKKGQKRCRVQCPRRAACSKRRSLALGTAQLGPSAAKDYLSTWLSAADRMGVAEHRSHKPT